MEIDHSNETPAKEAGVFFVDQFSVVVPVIPTNWLFLPD